MAVCQSFFWLLHLVAAVPWMGPAQTRVDRWPLDGFSPLPTQSPGLNGLPRELAKRAADFTLPPNYCGFVDGDTGKDLH